MKFVELQSQEHRILLDVIDTLRSEGVDNYIDLPQIVVCGDQSAGKSSILEAISGLSFPTKDSLCTRFATELVLRRDENAGIDVSIVPSKNQSEADQARLAQFQHQLDVTNPDLAGVTEAAKTAMRIGDFKAFSQDKLRVELKGPHLPHLTLVDLPGLFRAGNSEQSVEGVALVQDMVKEYIRRPRSIILAVISASADISLQDITELTRQFDPSGSRTLGLITKPDTLPQGSDRERSCIKLADNTNIKLKLGWHVLMNRSYETRFATSSERDAAETAFLSAGPWSRLDRSTVGIESLRTRLSVILKDQILDRLPDLQQEVTQGVADAKRLLQHLGEPRASLVQKQRFLRQLSTSFTMLITAAVSGHYSDAFFGPSSTKEGYQRRLRAVVQNQLLHFAMRMRREGRSKVIVTKGETIEDSDNDDIPRIARTVYLQHVQRVLIRSRGCELPGTFNPLIVQELFAEQSRPWQQIVDDAISAVVIAVRSTARVILEKVAVPEVLNVVSAKIDAMIDVLDSGVVAKVVEIMEQFTTMHPITYNHRLSELVRQMQQARADSYTHDMETNASNLAVDYMQAYYQIARDRLIDDVSGHALEREMLQRLPTIFDTNVIDTLSDDEVNKLAAESPATINERKRQSDRLATLSNAAQALQRLARYRRWSGVLPVGASTESLSSVEQPDNALDEQGQADNSEAVPTDAPVVTPTPVIFGQSQGTGGSFETWEFSDKTESGISWPHTSKLSKKKKKPWVADDPI